MVVAEVVGIDACRLRNKPAWVAVALKRGRFSAAGADRRLEPLLARHTGVEQIAIDMPIGLPDRDPRRCDVEARALLGQRRSSVFPAPPRAALELEDYAAANKRCRELTDHGLSTQSYGLRSRILELEPLVTADARLYEAHPELSFCELGGAPMKWSKKTWNGQQERIEVLRQAGIELQVELGAAGAVPVDDLFDACAIAWTADRRSRGEALALPADPAPGEPVIWR